MMMITTMMMMMMMMQVRKFENAGFGELLGFTVFFFGFSFGF